ncbi:MAG TPA: Flp pilus assembly protein CpaB [Xanthobacteraceae bacterium]|nr:Flp pilus assembly protein CpaB [Xanthobacteraceae bacterium]
MRTSTIVMIAFAVVFGLLAVFLANAWLNNRADEARRSLEAQRKAAPPAHTIVVARRPLRFGDVLSTLSLREIPWPEDAVPAGAFGKVGDLTATKRIVLAPIEVNEPILASKITGQGQRATLSSMLNDGMKAVTIRVNDVEGVAGFVQPGDHVDVVLTRPGERKTSINDVIIQNLRVLAVDQLADQTTEKPIVVKAVTLEVDETGGQKLSLAMQVGTLSLLLRKAGEIAEDATRQLTNADLAQGAGQTEDARSITIAVTRPTKDGTTRDEFNVPVERRDAHTAVLPAREMAHD